MSMTRTVHVRIEGLVQRVGYRAWTELAAEALHVHGWVRNRRDGSVEAVFHGPADEVTELLRRCNQGPPSARVRRIEILGEGVGSYDRFEVRPTA